MVLEMVSKLAALAEGTDLVPSTQTAIHNSL